MNENLEKEADCRLIQLPDFSDERGHLSLFDNRPSLPFMPKRVFWITHVPPGQERGKHAHKSCSEVLIAVSGSFKVTTKAKGVTKVFELSHPSVGLLIPPGAWCKLYEFSADGVCLVIASEDYDPQGYVSHS